jgi:hypothetical protein
LTLASPLRDVLEILEIFSPDRAIEAVYPGNPVPS